MLLLGKSFFLLLLEEFVVLGFPHQQRRVFLETVDSILPDMDILRTKVIAGGGYIADSDAVRGSIIQNLFNLLFQFLVLGTRLEFVALEKLRQARRNLSLALYPRFCTG